MLNRIWTRMVHRLYAARDEAELHRTSAAITRCDTPAAVAGITRHVLLAHASGKGLEDQAACARIDVREHSGPPRIVRPAELVQYRQARRVP
jgi:hypothetical protein